MAQSGRSSNKATAHLAVFVAMLFFSGWHVVGSLALKSGADPFVFALYREFIALFFMSVYAIWYRGLRLNIDRSDWLRFIFLGACSFVNVVGAMLALDFISPARFAIFQPMIPCIASVISILVGLENFSLLKAIGIAIAVSGAVIVEVFGKAASGRDVEKDVPLGTALVTVQIIAMANLIVFQKAIIKK
jgi:drug/metabolite transporter (DMT)-like permease